MDNTLLDQHKQTIERQRINIMGGKVIKYPKREIDIPAMFAILRKELGNPSLKDFASLIGYSESYISGVINESNEPIEIKKAFYLFSLYLANSDKDIPIVGQHYDF